MADSEFAGLTVEELVQLSEETTTGLRHNRSGPYRKAFTLLEGKGDEKRREEMRWEALAHDLVPRLNGKRFREEFVAETESGETIKYPDLSRDFPAEAVDYYRTRINETKNPMLRARYADLVWVLAKDGLAAVAAVNGYLESSGLYFAEGMWVQAADSVVRALMLSHEINSGASLSCTLNWADGLWNRIV